MKTFRCAKVLVPLNHFVHRIVLLIAQISMVMMVAIVTLTVVLRYAFNTGLAGGGSRACRSRVFAFYRLRYRRATTCTWPSTRFTIRRPGASPGRSARCSTC